LPSPKPKSNIAVYNSIRKPIGAKAVGAVERREIVDFY